MSFSSYRFAARCPKISKFLELPVWRNKLYQIVTWSKSFEVPWNNVNVPLVVQNKDNIFTSSVIRSQKYWYFTINSLVRFAHSFVYLVKYQYFCSLIPSVVKILSLFFTTRGTLLQYCKIQDCDYNFRMIEASTVAVNCKGNNHAKIDWL